MPGKFCSGIPHTNSAPKSTEVASLPSIIRKPMPDAVPPPPPPVAAFQGPVAAVGGQDVYETMDDANLPPEEVEATYEDIAEGTVRSAAAPSLRN